MKILRLSALLMLVALLAVACASSSPVEDAPADTAGEAPAGEMESAEENLTEGCVEDYAEGVDYFPNKVEPEYSNNFSVEYHDNYKLVTTLTPWPGADTTFEYVLVQCGTPVPEGFDDAAVIEVPVGEVVVMSTTYITNLDDLGMLDRLVGLDAFAYTTNPAVRNMIDAGELAEIAPTGQEVNVEVALDLDPDMIMAFSSGVSEYDLHPAMIQAGLPVVMNADWMENSPLARAEWIKFMSLFFNAEGRANEVFTGIVNDYEAALELAASAEEKPTVVTNVPYEGTWYVPGGQAFTAQLIADAGGDYIFSDNEETGTLFLDFETVYDAGQDADIWISVFGFDTRANMLAVDERFGDFEAFQEGQVYGNDKRGSDFGTELYETGYVHPHVVLQDLVKIFHPDLLPDHELYYYRPIE